MKQLVVIIVAAALIGYDLFMLNGYYLRLVVAQASAAWNAAESFFLALL